MAHAIGQSIKTWLVNRSAAAIHDFIAMLVRRNENLNCIAQTIFPFGEKTQRMISRTVLSVRNIQMGVGIFSSKVKLGSQAIGSGGG